MNPDNSEKAKRRRIKEYKERENAYLSRQEFREKYDKEKKVQIEENKKALLYFISLIEESFPEYRELLQESVFELWKQRRYTREARYAFHDVEECISIITGVGLTKTVKRKIHACQLKLLMSL